MASDAQKNLDETLRQLPQQPAEWTPEQLRQYADASNEVMRQQTYGQK
ncbi:MAG: hypothetical protein LBV60_25800 [Streptomyces sp.]|jgi:hypothetical protein|nr:hypothetical protein [Streptomyces sp.]